MKKLIVLMMCVTLLLSGCAAVTAEGPGTGFQIGDLVVTSAEGDVLDLTGLTFNYELAESDTGMGTRCHISADGQESADVIFALVGQYLYVSLPGAEATHNYALDQAKVSQVLTEAIENISNEVNGILPAIFPGTTMPTDEAPEEYGDVPEMTDEELEAAMAELEEAMAEMEDGGEYDYYAPEADDYEAFATVPGMSEEDMAAQQAMQEKINEIMNRCMTAEMTQIDGEDFQVITFDIGPEDMAELLDASPSLFSFNVGGEPVATLGQLLNAANVAVAMRGTVTGNEDFSRFMIDLTPTYTVKESETSFTVTIDSMAGDGAVAVSVSAQQDGQSTGALSLVLAATVAEDASWLPAELDADTVVLTEMSLDQVKQALSEGFDDYMALFQSMAESVDQANQAG